MKKREYILIIIIFFLTLTVFSKCFSAKELIRNSYVAGRFYPYNKEELLRMIDSYLNEAERTTSEYKNYEIVGLLCPHAGYIYSGKTAGYSYSCIKGNQYDCVVILGPFHNVIRVPVPPFAASIFPGDFYKTPLGLARLDKDFIKKLKTMSQLFAGILMVHTGEHSIEVQIPFIQRVLPDTPIVPILIGTGDFEISKRIGKILANLIKKTGKKVLIVASSDLSHLSNQKNDSLTNKKDNLTLKLVSEFNVESLINELRNGNCEMCGRIPVIAMLSALKELGINKAKILNHRHSAMVSNNYGYVVGYGSVVFYKKPFINKETAEELLKLCDKAVKEYIVHGKRLKPDLKIDSYHPSYSVFVSIYNKGKLRGCVGNLTSNNLIEAVIDSAIKSATADPRFPRIKKEELKNLTYELTLVERRFKKLKNKDLSRIIIGKHGIMVKSGDKSALLLPQVAKKYSMDGLKFVNACMKKAGLSHKSYKNKDIEIYIFRAKNYK